MTAAVELPARTRSYSLIFSGAAIGTAVQLVVTFVYALIRIGFHLAANHLVPAGGTTLPAPETADKIFGIEVIGGLLSVGPSALAGAFLGALLGLILRLTWRRQGLLGSWLTGSLLAFVAAVIVNVVVIGRARTVPLRYSEWAPLLGYPSVLLIIVFGGIGVWLFQTDPEHRRA